MTRCGRSSQPSSTPSCDGSTNSRAQAIARAILWLIASVCAVLVLASEFGCSRTVLVSEASPIRVGPDCASKVYTKTEDGWRLSDNKVTIPEGWYCVPPSYVEDEP